MADVVAPIESHDRPQTTGRQQDRNCTNPASPADALKMQEKTCNLWSEKADYRCIPTTGATTDDGEAILESNVARQAAQRYAGLAVDLGRLLTSRGNHVHLIRPGLLSFPIQQYAWSGPSLQTIQRSAGELAAIVGDGKTLLPWPGEGVLVREQVAQALSGLPDNIIVVQHV